MIRVKNLTKKFGETKAVNDISFEIKTGEIVGFLGPNGAGKTTTVRIITCYMPPTSGTVEIDDMDALEHSLEVRRKIGYLPESTPLYYEMNVVDYLKFIAEMRGIPPSNRTKSIKKVIDACGLSDVVRKDIGELSKGYKQRVGIAQAMIHDPEILILDEPTSGLDPNQIIEIRNLIKELGLKKTVILCTHILSEVQATCDRVLIINKGKIVADGSPEELQSELHGKERIYLEVKSQQPDEVKNKLKELSQIEDLKEVKSDDSIRGYRIESAKGMDIREEIFNFAVKQNWIILEMKREQTSLEDVFRQLTVDK